MAKKPDTTYPIKDKRTDQPEKLGTLVEGTNMIATDIESHDQGG